MGGQELADTGEKRRPSPIFSSLSRNRKSPTGLSSIPRCPERVRRACADAAQQLGLDTAASQQFPHPTATSRVSAPIVSYPVVGASGSVSGFDSGSGNQRMPTLTDLLYQLATRWVTSARIGSPFTARHRCEPVHIERLPGGAHRVGPGRRRRGRPAAGRRRHRAAAGHPDRGQRRRRRCWSADRVRHRRVRRGPPPRMPRWCAGCKAAGAVIVGKTNTCELGQWPFTSGPGFGHTRNPWSRRAHTGRLVGRQRRRGGRGAGDRRHRLRRCGQRPHPRGVDTPGRASSRSAAASPPGRCRRRSTASRSTACWPARWPTRRWCSTRRPATSKAICTSRRR